MVYSSNVDVSSTNCNWQATRGMINKQALSLMKPTAILINASRGPVVDQEALAEALKKGTIAAAGE